MEKVVEVPPRHYGAPVRYEITSTDADGNVIKRIVETQCSPTTVATT